MILQKWDFNKRDYLPFEVPDDRRVILYATDMNISIDCANCGKDMTFGEGYTSRTIHNHIGLGYPVCGDCYEEENKLKESKQR